MTGGITGVSDIDVLVAIPDGYSEPEAYVKMCRKLEELGSAAYALDLHVVQGSRLNRPPYSWWLEGSCRVA